MVSKITSPLCNLNCVIVLRASRLRHLFVLLAWAEDLPVGVSDLSVDAIGISAVSEMTLHQ